MKCVRRFPNTTTISQSCLKADTFAEPGFLSTLGHRGALQSRRYRDADTFKTPTEGIGSVLATTHCSLGEAGLFPLRVQLGQNRVGWVEGGSAELAPEALGLSRSSQPTLLISGAGWSGVHSSATQPTLTSQSRPSTWSINTTPTTRRADLRCETGRKSITQRDWILHAKSSPTVICLFALQSQKDRLCQLWTGLP